MPKYEVTMDWSFSCRHTIEAASEEEAIKIAEQQEHSDEEWAALARNPYLEGTDVEEVVESK